MLRKARCVGYTDPILATLEKEAYKNKPAGEDDLYPHRINRLKVIVVRNIAGEPVTAPASARQHRRSGGGWLLLRGTDDLVDRLEDIAQAENANDFPTTCDQQRQLPAADQPVHREVER